MSQVYTLFCIVATVVSTRNAESTDVTETLYVENGGNASVSFDSGRFVAVICYNKNDDKVFDSDDSTQFQRYHYEQQTGNSHRLNMFNVKPDNVIDKCRVLDQTYHYELNLDFEFYEVTLQFYPTDVIPSTDTVDIEEGLTMVLCLSKTSFKISDLTTNLGLLSSTSMSHMTLNNHNTSDEVYDSMVMSLVHVGRNHHGYIASCSMIHSIIGDSEPKIISQQVRLRVLYGAEFTNLDELADGFVVPEGGDVRLLCSATGNPENVKYNWTTVSGVQLSSSSSLDIINASCERDQGVYICTISNGIGQPKSTVTLLSVKCAPEPTQNPLSFVRITNIKCYSLEIEWDKDIVNRSEEIVFHVECTSAGTWTNETWIPNGRHAQEYSHRVDSLQPATDYKLRVYADDKYGRIWEQVLFATTKYCVECNDFKKIIGSQEDLGLYDITVFEMGLTVGAFLIGCLLSGGIVHCHMKSNDERGAKPQKYEMYLPQNKEAKFYQEINKAQYQMSINPMAAHTMSINQRAQDNMAATATESEYLSPLEDHIYACAGEIRGTP